MGKYSQTVTQQEILDVLSNFQFILDEQLKILFIRNNKTEEKVKNAIRNLSNEGYLFYEKEKGCWKLNKNEEVNMNLINCLWLMMCNTEDEANELEIYRNAIANTGNPFITYVKNDTIYYIMYFQNKGSALSFRMIENKLDGSGARGTDDCVKLIFMSESKDVLDFIQSKYPTIKILIEKHGYQQPDFYVI